MCCGRSSSSCCFLLCFLLLLPVAAHGFRRPFIGGVVGFSDSTVSGLGFARRKSLDDGQNHPMLFRTDAPDGDATLEEVGAHRKGKLKLTDYVIIVSMFLIFVAFCLYIYLNWRNLPRFSSHADQQVEDFLTIHTHLSVRRYRYSEVKHMTSHFRHSIGHGACANVYKGMLYDGTAVAVKILNETKVSGEEFINEVASISRTNHVNVVGLLGFCSEGTKRALIYEYMPNGSLEKFLFVDDPNTSASLTWEQKHNIALGIARGLEYLHLGCNTPMVHFDIKPHNILLDEDLCPKISDFGLAKLYKDNESVLSTVYARGTMGYIAPEVFSRNFGVVSSKSDVYSYGMLVLEMVGGRRNLSTEVGNASEVYFPHWIREHLDQECGLKACGVTPGSEEVVRKMILVGLWCIQLKPVSRPSMSEAVDMLEGNVHGLGIPPKPYMSLEERSGPDIDAEYSSSIFVSNDSANTSV